MGALRGDQYIFLIMCRSFLLRIKIFRTKFVEKLETHILCSINFFFENHVVYEIMWKNIAERGRPQMRVWHMRIACWIPKATNTHFPLQQWLQERTSILSYTHIAFLV